MQPFGHTLTNDLMESAMKEVRIDVDWSKLLGFDQATPGTDVLKHAAKIGNKPCPTYRAFNGSEPQAVSKS